MISRLDPLREAGLQGLVAETSLATRKHSSSIFLLENTTQLLGGREQEHQMQAMASESWCFWQDLLPALYSHVKLHWKTTCDATVVAITSVVMQILCTVNLHVDKQ